MRKSTQHLLLFLTVFLMGTAVQAQTVILSENFEGAGLPTGWTRSQDTPSHGWEFGASTTLSSTYFTIPTHTKNAASNDDKWDDTSNVKNKADRDLLMTPTLDLSTVTSALVSFDAFFLGQANPNPDNSHAYLLASRDNGTTWDTLLTIPGSQSWQTLTINLANYVGSNTVKVGFAYNDANQWSYGFAIDNVSIISPPALDAALISTSIPSLVTVSSSAPTLIPIVGTLENLGASTITAATINWSINGGSPQSENLHAISILTTATNLFTLTNKISIASPGTYNVQIWVSDPNNGTDGNLNNDTISTSISALGAKAHKNVLLEEGTGAWCGWCIDGAYDVDTITAAHGDVVAVALHNGDGMTTTAGDGVISAYINAFPGGIVDRVPFAGTIQQSRDLWGGEAVSELAVTTVASVGLLSSYDQASRTINATVVAKFQDAVSGDYRVNLYICENDVTGTGANYDQHNYLSNTVNPGVFPTSPFYNLPSVVTGFHHMRVVRQMMGGSWGSSGVIPATVNINDEFAKQYSYTVPVGYKDTSLFLVAVVQQYNVDGNSRPIVNVVKGTLNGYTQTPVTNYYYTTIGDTINNGDSLVFHHGDTLYYQGGSMVFQLGDTVTINGVATVIDSINQVIVVQNGDLVTVTGPNGAGSTTIPTGHYYTQTSYGSVDVTAVAPTGINNVADAQETLSVYPNPATSELNLSLSLIKAGDVHITLTNVAGQQVKVLDATNMANGGSNIRFSTAELPAGVYMLNVRTTQSSMSHKVVIAR